MRRWLKIFMLICVLVNSGRTAEPIRSMDLSMATKATDRSLKLTDELLRLLNFERVYNASVREQIETMFTNNPQLKRYAEAINNFYEQHLSYATLKNQIQQLYAETFSEKELQELNAFFATASGRKWIENYPNLLRKIHDLGQAETRAHRDELQKIIGGNPEKLVGADEDPEIELDNQAENSIDTNVPADDNNVDDNW